jgi:hypothetical protein
MSWGEIMMNLEIAACDRIEKECEARRKAEQNALERNFGKDGKKEARVYDKFFKHDTYIGKEEYLKYKDNYILY